MNFFRIATIVACLIVFSFAYFMCVKAAPKAETVFDVKPVIEVEPVSEDEDEDCLKYCPYTLAGEDISMARFDEEDEE